MSTISKKLRSLTPTRNSAASDVRKVEPLSPTWRGEDDSEPFSGEMKIEDVVTAEVKKSTSEISWDSSGELEYPWNSEGREGIRHITFAHQEPKNLPSDLPLVDDDDPLSISEHSSRSLTVPKRGRRQVSPGSRVPKSPPSSLSPLRSHQRTQSFQLKRSTSNNEDGDANSMRGYAEPFAIDELSPALSPPTPSHMKKGRLSTGAEGPQKRTSGKLIRVSHMDSLSRARRPSSWSPVPPADRRKNAAMERHSVASSKPTTNNEELVRSFLMQEGPQRSHHSREADEGPPGPPPPPLLQLSRRSGHLSRHSGIDMQSMAIDELSSTLSPNTPSQRKKSSRLSTGAKRPSQKRTSSLLNDLSSILSPLTPSHKKKSGRLSTGAERPSLQRTSANFRLSHRESLSRGERSSSSWSPVPPKDRKKNAAIERHSVSTSKPTNEDLMRSLSHQVGPPLLHSYSDFDDASSVQSRSSDRSSVICSMAKRHVDEFSMGGDEPVSPGTPRPRGRKSVSSRRHGVEHSSSSKTPKTGNLRPSQHRPSSWSPVPPKDRNKMSTTMERHSVSTSKPTIREEDPQDDDQSLMSHGSFCDDSSQLSGSQRSERSRLTRRISGRKADDRLSVSERLMRTSDFQERAQAAMDELTINKLRYEMVGLVGREKESEILRKCYSRVTNVDHDASSSLKKELVLVKGYSGVGKSTLVSPILKMCDQSATGFCARGKFDFNSVNVPYTAIASAFDLIFGRIDSRDEWRRGPQAASTNNDSEKLRAVGQILTEKLGPDMHLLARLIPNMSGMVPKFVRQPSVRRLDDNNDFDAGQNRWEHALLVLTRELNKIYSPFVLFFDDMQWADSASLNLIEALISDVENENPLMVIGCYRPNVNGPDDLLTNKVEQLTLKKSKHGFNLSEIEIGELDKEGVHDIIMTLLSMDDKEATGALADICYRRTNGNPFFVIEFMTMLTEEDLIQFSLGSFTWTFDKEEVERETMSTENVVDIVQSRMKKLSKSAQTILQYAACLGSTIRVECLEILVSNMSNLEDNDEGLPDWIEELEDGGFIEKIKPLEYQWVHDNIRESALKFGDASAQLFQFEVGNTLLHYMDEVDLEDMLFEVCDLINLGDHSRREEFAKLNLQAAQKARRISAFQIATSYAIKGISYLQNGKWTEQHELALQLYSLAMEMELAVGRIVEMEKYAAEILAQPNCTPIQKLPVYLAKSHKMTHLDMDYKRCTDMLLGILSENYKIQLRKSVLPVQAVTSVLSIARKVKKLPKGALASLEPVVNSDLEAAMELLVRLSISSYLGKDMVLHLRCITKMVQMTMKHGVQSMSGFAFCGLGTCIMALNGEAAEGALFVKMAEELQAIAPDDYAAASTLTISNLMVLPWISSLNACRSALKEGYSAGLRAGNTENAMLSLFAYNVLIPFQMGKPLASIESKCTEICSQCEDLKLGLYSVSVRQYWESILDLMGKPDPTVFSISKELFKEGWKAEELIVQYMGLNTAVFSGDFVTATEIALKMGDGFQKSHPCNILLMSETFLRAVALYATCSNHKAKRIANKLRQRMGSWVKKGNPNVGHCYHLLCAEKARLDGKYDKANALYNDAIVLAARTGHIHHAALTNERYADFLLRCKMDKEESDYRIQKAIGFYQDWGATKRVQQLTKLQSLDA